MESLWPNLETISKDVPVQILKEQADIFNRELKGLLECKVETSEVPLGKSYISSIESDLTAKLVVTSPNLYNYSLVLVQVNNKISKAYPCEVINCLSEYLLSNSEIANNAGEFKHILGTILKSDNVVTALQNLIAQTQHL